MKPETELRVMRWLALVMQATTFIALVVFMLFMVFLFLVFLRGHV